VGQFAHIKGRTFAITGVLKQDLPTIAEMPDLMLDIADDLEQIAQYKGEVPQMLYYTTNDARSTKCCLRRGCWAALERWHADRLLSFDLCLN
jgi:hypothetical protein